MERKPRYIHTNGNKTMKIARKNKKKTIKKRKVKGGALIIFEIYNNFIKPYFPDDKPNTNLNKVVDKQPQNPLEPKAVSYTHLTLPTIYSV